MPSPTTTAPGPAAAIRPRVEVACGNEAVDLLDARWDELLYRQDVPNPALSSTWLRHIASSEVGEPLVVVVEAGGRLLAAGACARRRLGGRVVSASSPGSATPIY